MNKINFSQVTTIIVLFLGLALASLNFGLLGPAIPQIQSQFGLNERSVLWVVNIYVLAYLLGAISNARFSDKFGRRNIYLISIASFGIGCLVLFISNSFYMLLIGRIIQGFFIGGIFPLTGSMVGDKYPQKERGKVLGIITASFGIFFLTGPNIGYFLLPYGWNLISLINIPLVFLILILGYLGLPETNIKRIKSIDLVGILFLGLCLLFLALGVGQINTRLFFDSLWNYNIIIPLILALIFLFMLYLREKRAEFPFIEYGFIKRRNIFLTILLAIISGAMEIGMLFLPVYYNNILSFDIASFWLIVVPAVPVIFISSIMLGVLLDRFGSRFVLILCSLSSTIGYILTVYYPETILIFIMGVSLISITFAAVSGVLLRYIMLNATKTRERALGQSLVTMSKNIGRLMGTTIFGAILVSQVTLLIGFKSAYLFIVITSFSMLIIGLFIGKRGFCAEEECIEGEF